MNLYIQIENGQPINHPAFEDNLIHAFGSIPSNWEPFTRIHQPLDLLTTPFQKAEFSYALGNDGKTWQDVWTAVEITEEERAALIAKTLNNPPFKNAVLNTSDLTWSKPPKPNDGKNYLFNRQTGSYVEAPTKPTDGQNYTFDWPTMTWVVIPSNPTV